MAGLLLAACQTATAPVISPSLVSIDGIDRRGPAPLDGIEADELDDFRRFYVATTLRSEDQHKGNIVTRLYGLNKWAWGGVTYGVDEDFSDQQKKDIDAVFALIGDITGVKLVRGATMRNVRAGEIMVHALTERAVKTRTARGGSFVICTGQMHWPNSASRAIIAAELYLPARDGIDWDDCVYEELGHAFAFGRDTSDFPHRTIFTNDRSHRPVGFTPFDKLNLWVTYDPRLKPGMTYAEAEPIVRTIVNELREKMAAG